MPPRAFFFPVQQHDPVTCAELLQTLARGAVEVEEATAAAPGRRRRLPGRHPRRPPRPTGRQFCQDAPRGPDLPRPAPWPGGPPRPPYDIAGHTLPIQMGVRVVSVKGPLAGRGARSRRVPSGCGAEADALPLRRLAEVPLPVGTVTGRGAMAGGSGPNLNRSVLAVEPPAGGRFPVHRAAERVPGLALPPGSYLLPARRG